jgi:hypothetical protein
MWGNLHGWLISLVLAGLILTPVAWLARMSSVTAPRGIALDPKNLMAMELPMSPEEAWPIFSDDSDAGDSYKQVCAAWNSDAEAECEKFVATPTRQIPAALQPLIDARHCQRMVLFAADLPAVVNYANEQPDLDNLFAAGEWTYKAGLSLGVHGQTAEARDYLEAAFALGRQLWQERVVFDECQKGMELMSDAAGAMCHISTKGSELYDRLSEFQKEMQDYQSQRIVPIWAVMSGVGEPIIEQSAGDILMFANQSKERMWRVEAVLALGRYQFNAATRGDQIGAARAVRKLADDPDPAVAAAGAAARDLTIETYRMIR